MGVQIFLVHVMLVTVSTREAAQSHVDRLHMPGEGAALLEALFTVLASVRHHTRVRSDVHVHRSLVDGSEVANWTEMRFLSGMPHLVVGQLLA